MTPDPADPLARLAASAGQRPPAPAPTIYRLTDADLDRDIPPEYRGATLLPALVGILRQRPVSVLLMGPPGTGKTRQGWAMLRASRRQRCAALFTDGQPLAAVWTGKTWTLPRTRDAWAGEVLGTDTVLLISESAHLRRHRFDYEWLDRPARHRGWLVVDDIGYQEPNPWVIDAIYHLANERRAWKRPTLWTTNTSPDGLRECLGGAIASRLLGGAVANLDGADRRVGEP